MKTDIPLSPIDLYKKFSGTDAKALVSFQALAALNIHLGGDKNTSKNAIREWLHNLTYQALTNENDKIIMSFDLIGELVLGILEQLAKIELNLVNDAIKLGELLKSKLNETEYDLQLAPEMEIQNNIKKYQKGDKKLPPQVTSTPIKSTEQINRDRDEDLENYLKTAITINKTDLDAAIEAAKESKKQVIDEMINPIPGLIVDDKFNTSSDIARFNDNETNFSLANDIQKTRRYFTK